MPTPAPAKNKTSSRWLRFLALFVCGIAGTPSVAAVDPGLLVEAAAGAVKIRMATGTSPGTADRWATPVIGSTVTLPATVSTGADGSARLRHDRTVISVAADTAIELLDGEGSGILQRAVQERGSAFYDIAPQGGNKFRVETPYLVAVIKGTQFNVTVSDEVASVSLFEGKLRIEAPDIDDAVDLNAGQIAQRRKGEQQITVLDMADGEPVSRHDKGTPDSTRTAGDDKGVRATTEPVKNTDADLAADGKVVIGSSGTGTRLEGDVRLDKDGVNTTAEAKLNTGGIAGAELGVEAGIDPAGTEATVSLQESAGLGDTSVDTGVDTRIDLDGGEVDLGIDNALDTGGTVIDTGIDTSLDLGDGSVDLGVDGALDLVDADLGIDPDSGIDLNLDLGADGELLDVDLGLGGLTDPQDETVVEEDTNTLLPDLGNLLGR